MEHRLDKLGRYTTGWVAYFKLADSPRVFDEIDQWTRRRLRQAQWVQWKTTNRKSSMLRKLGYELGNRKMGSLRRRHWFASGLKPLDVGMNNAYWEAQGYRSFKGSCSAGVKVRLDLRDP
jgi:RNA-directed DNA polymerase